MKHLLRFVAFALCLMMTSVVVAAQRSPLLRVRLVPETKKSSESLGGPAWAEVVKECQRIWMAEQVVVIRGDQETDADVSIPLFFDHRRLLKYDVPKGQAFGVTVFRGLTREIVLSIPRAREAAYREPEIGARGLSSAGTVDTVMARILGRVVAHEIGHVLLLQSGHGVSGLMRPQVDMRDLGTGAEGQFALSPAERLRLATLFPNRHRGSQ
jgi:hypothetical protein